MPRQPEIKNPLRPPQYASEVERLCGYIKNDSIVRWHLGCSQPDIDRARSTLAKRRPYSSGYVNKSARTDELCEERQRVKRAKAGNKAYLAAVKRAQVK